MTWTNPRIIDETVEAKPAEVRPDYASPDYYYIDGGCAYWLFGGVLFYAPMSAADHSVIWADAGEVDLYMIDPDDALYCRRVLKALGELESALMTFREGQ